MNTRTTENANEKWRWRNGGWARAEQAEPGEMAAAGYRGLLKALSVYENSDYGRRLRASDIRRRMSPAEFNRLMARRERQFGLPAGSLKRRPVEAERR